ncbi:MAG: rod shape-determining protein MreC [Oscillospiraceae bacterium]|nr:rod shape-determining protein MreC [Candidatus Ruminococcus equi]
MKEFLKSNSVKVLVCIIFVLIMVFVFTHNVQNNFLSSSLSSLTYGLSKVTAVSTDNEAQKPYSELQRENENLKKENADLRAKLVDYYSAKEENARLWKFYNLKKENPEYTLVPAMVLRRDANDDFSSFTLDKGSSSSVKVNDPVVTENGVIGRVSEVDNNTCKVVTILSPQTSIGCIDKKSKDTGIVSGNANYSNDNLTTFAKLSSDNKVKEGDIITTTGISGLYPKDLIIGEVEEICYDNFDTSFYAVVRPYDDIKTITCVAVITEFTGQGEILKSGD